MTAANLEAFKCTYRATDGTDKEMEISLQDYRASAQTGHIGAHLMQKYPDFDRNYGTPLSQAFEQAGFDLNTQSNNRITVGEALSGRSMQAGSVVRQDGSDTSVGARILMPQLLVSIQETSLPQNTSRLRQAFLSKLALRTPVTQPIYQRPTVNADTNKDFDATQIGQGSMPDTIIKIDVGDKAFNIPTKSFGLEISEQAVQSATIDQVAAMIASARRSIDNKAIYRWISRIVSGDPLYDVAALTPVLASSYDPAATGGAMTQLAWLKMLTEDMEYWEADTIIANTDSMYAIDNRANRPTVSDDNGRDNRINNSLNLMNLDIDTMDTMIVADDAVLGASTQFLMFDSSQSLEWVTNTSARYEATQDFVMRRTTQMRFDHAEEVIPYRQDTMKLVNRA